MGLNAPKEKLDEIPDEVRATAAATLLIARAVQLVTMAVVWLCGWQERRELINALKTKWDAVNAKYQKITHMVKIESFGLLKRWASREDI